MKKSYCTKNDSEVADCKNCSLCNQGRDCQNRSIAFDDFFASDILESVPEFGFSGFSEPDPDNDYPMV